LSVLLILMELLFKLSFNFARMKWMTIVSKISLIHDVKQVIILRFVSVTSQGLDFQCHMLWVFCVQWVKMRGDCLFCWYWWNCILNFRFRLHKQNSYQSSRELSWTYQQWVGVITKFSQHLKDNSCEDDKSKYNSATPLGNQIYHSFLQVYINVKIVEFFL
jgi:hypothetical protein